MLNIIDCRRLTLLICAVDSWTSLEFEELLERGGAPGPKKSEFMRLVDLNGDGLISYEEFMLFSTLAAIPASKIRIAFQMFDADGSGEIDRYGSPIHFAISRPQSAHELARKHQR
jgi:hypothetical protein